MRKMLSVVACTALTLTFGCEPDVTDSGAMEEMATGEPMGLNEGDVRPGEAEQEPVDEGEGRVFAYVVDPGAETPEPVTEAVAILRPTQGNELRGTVRFVDRKDGTGLAVIADVEGLPQGKHAYHVHLYGDCSGDDAKTAGTHFNFEGSSKNPPEEIARITGNLGELEADGEGKAQAEATVNHASLSGRFSILGRSVIVHEDANDPEKPPIGGAGARLACGTIGIAKAGGAQQAAL